MRRGSRRRGPGLRAETLGPLEELVHTVAALDGPRAATLLSGLSGALRPTALELLRRLERCSRADRHARLASAFTARPPDLPFPTGIPGQLGAEVRKELVRGAASAGLPPDGGPMARWARRLVREHGAS